MVQNLRRPHFHRSSPDGTHRRVCRHYSGSALPTRRPRALSRDCAPPPRRPPEAEGHAKGNGRLGRHPPRIVDRCVKETGMDFQFTEEQEEIRKQVRALCSRFPDEYWRERDETGEFPWDFYQAFADGGWLGITITREYGGSGLGITEAALVMQTVAECGGGTQACSSIHLGIFGLEPLIKYGTEEARRKYLPKVLSGETHVSFAVTEPDAGTNT